MHVHTLTTLSPEAVRTRFEAADTRSGPSTGSRRLIYAKDRVPPKFFLTGMPVTLPAAAEVSVTGRSGGSDVVLRLMWGPLPAPFPRALAGLGALLALLLVGASDGTWGDWLGASLLLLLPLVLLLYQRQGERELQSRLSGLLDGARFTPRPH